MQTCRTIVVASLLAATVHAQCGLAWRPGVGINGVDDFVYDLTTWDPDGAGPAPLQVVVAGEFLKAGHAVAAHIATWNPATGDWAQLGGGVSGRVQALEIAANGDLIVAGTFYSVGNVSARSIARWNGTAWAALGLGIDGSVADVAALPNGDIVAVGSFTTAGGVLATNVARWNGASWSALGTGTNDRVSAVVALPNGDVVVGGEFTSIGGVAANRIARWNGSAWLPLGTGVDGAPLPQSTIAVYSLARLPNGDLVVGGHFANAGAVAAPYVARWNGSAWSPMGAGLAGVTTSLHVQPNGMLIADSPHTPGATRPSQWNGVSWQPIAPGLVNPYRFATLPNGDLVAGGAFVFTTVGGQRVERVARWDGAAWSALSSPPINPWFSTALPGIRSIASTPDGTLYAIGTFDVVDGVLLNGVARFNGASWNGLGSGIGSWPIPYPWPLALQAMSDGDIVVGGFINSIAGAPATNVVRWNGSSWSNLAGGVDAPVMAFAELPNGDLIAAGGFTTAGGLPANRIARWDGTAWHALGLGINDTVGSVLALPNGDVIAAGQFTSAGGSGANGVARWNGSTWSPLGSGHAFGISHLRQLPNGDIVAVFGGVPFSNAGTVQRWNGTTWTQLGAPLPGVAYGLVVLPDGDLLVSGSPTVGVAYTLRWDNGTWTSFAGPIGAPFASSTWLPDGDLVVAGGFYAAGPQLSPTIARLTSTCAASSVPAGVGCASSGGNNTLATKALPWLGSTFRAEGTGLPTLALVSQVYGFQAMQLPLAALLPQALPGCDLLVTPDFVQFSVTTTGSAQTSLAIPANASLVGAQVHHQLNLLEVDAMLNLIAVTASNALVLTVGVF